MRVAALADVHGNAPALAAVLDEVEREAPDLVVFCGDLTWGSLPRETLALVRSLRIAARFVRGNADRAVGTDLDGARPPWMASMHTAEDLAFLASFEPTVQIDVEGLGPSCFCHGSPRSDIECVTERTPPERVREFMVGLDAGVVVTAHVHVELRPSRGRCPTGQPGQCRAAVRRTARRVLGAPRPGCRASAHRVRGGGGCRTDAGDG